MTQKSDPAICCAPADFDPIPGADPECHLCGGDGMITNEDIFAPEQSLWERCSCVGSESAARASSGPRIAPGLQGWLPGSYRVRARYAGAERPLSVITDVVLHSLTTGKHAAGPRYFKNPGDGRLVSAHFVVHRGWERSSTQCVPITRVAYHAGSKALNAKSVGIEQDGPFAPGQYTPEMYSEICRIVEALKDLGCPLERIVSHRSTAPKRRADPGEWFDWTQLSGLGLVLVP